MKLTTRQVQQLALLSDLLDMIQNPDKMVALIKEAQEAEESIKDVMEKQRKIDDIDKWYQSQKNKLDERESLLKQKEDNFIDTLREHEHDHRVAMEKVADSKKLADRKLVELDLAKKEFDAVGAMAHEVKEKEDKLNKKAKELDILEKELKETKAKLDAILGG